MKLHKDGTLEGTPQENNAIKIIKIGDNTKFILEFPPEFTPEKRISYTRDFAKWVNEPGTQVTLLADGVRIVMFVQEE